MKPNLNIFFVCFSFLSCVSCEQDAVMMGWREWTPSRYFVNNSRFFFSPQKIFHPLSQYIRPLLNFSSSLKIEFSIAEQIFIFSLVRNFSDRQLFPLCIFMEKLKTRLFSSTRMRELKISWKLCHIFMFKSQQLSLICRVFECACHKDRREGKFGVFQSPRT